jgi:hypothetical protein
MDSSRERREIRKEGRELPSRIRLRDGRISVRITLGQPTMIAMQQHMTPTAWR